MVAKIHKCGLLLSRYQQKCCTFAENKDGIIDMTIGVISAMDSEHRRLVERLQDGKTSGDGSFSYAEGMLGGNRVVLTQCGIGKVSAAVGASELIRRFAPDCVVSTGVAGGIDTCLRVTDVVVSERLVYHDVWCGDDNKYGQVQGFPAVYEGCPALLKHALQLNGVGMESHIHSGLVCTGDKFITNRTELDAIKRRFPDGLAVDMESAAIAQACYLYNTPFLSFRIISDTPGVEDHASQYADFWGTMAERSFLTTWTFLSTLPTEIDTY